MDCMWELTFLFDKYESFSCVYASVLHMYAWCPQWPEEGVLSLWPGIRDNYKLPLGSPSPKEIVHQSVLLTDFKILNYQSQKGQTSSHQGSAISTGLKEDYGRLNRARIFRRYEIFLVEGMELSLRILS